MRILVAEDTPAISTLIEACLGRAGHQVDLAADGRSAVERFTAQAYDLVILDMRMPVMDGYAAAAEMRRHEKTGGAGRAVPIIGLTAGTAPGEAARCRAAGCSGFLPKPFTRADLLALVSQPAAEPAAAGPDPEWADLIPGLVAALRRDLASMKEALASRESSRLADFGHRLAGTGASYGFPELSRLGRALEAGAGGGDAAVLETLLRELSDCLDRIPAPAAGRKPTVLVVEDDESMRLLIERWLSTSGCSVFATAEGRAGLARAKEVRPDLILTDVMMPGMDGYALCAGLQEEPALAAVPVIFLTALSQEKDRAAALAAGAVEHIAKPVQKEALAAAVHKHLATRTRWRQLQKDAVSFPARRTADYRRFLDFAGRQAGAPAEALARLDAGSSRDFYAHAEQLGAEPEQLARWAAQFLSLDYLPRIDPDSIQLDALPLPFCREHQVVVVETRPGRNAFVVSNPFQAELFDILKRYPLLGDPRQPLVTEPGNILRLLKLPARETGAAPPREGGDKVPISTLADDLLERAVAARASDIHIEPKESGAAVRLRVDGDLREDCRLSPESGQMLVSRFKALADMDVAERRRPQDGALETTIAGRSFIVRLATTATPHGESAVLRLLEPRAKPKPLQELGLAESQVAHMLDFARRQHGMVLIAGPTGSGKTTTIYSLLQHIDCESRSLISIEDPVEYRIPAANQQQVDEKAGSTFESLLKSAVRQDPDILFLGEIRDAFSAKMALDFSSTGHLTLSSVHTTNATTAVFRLERLGISRAAMADSLLGVVAQKLLKKVCPHCRRLGAPTPKEIEMLASATADIPEAVAHPQGCPRCSQTGYLGREGVYEIVTFYPEISDMIRRGAPITEIRDFARRRGDFLVTDHALAKVKAGLFAVKDVFEQVLLEEVEYAHRRQAAAPEPAPAQVGPPAPPEAAPAAASILVVEDDPSTLALIQRILVNGGHCVTPAGDGADALLQLAIRRFDLILSDINMPNLDGLKLLELKSLKGIATPVVFLTAQAGQELEAQGFQLGAADYIRKPVSKEVLLLRVRRVLAGRP
ncbi:MAG: Flp pilus assembly complex ATPase component TadA [Elusimicrobia bacterium]|nr:Flp pilus assembly complex ATPase component TadA [Elusimicrobiota bacterium]